MNKKIQLILKNYKEYVLRAGSFLSPKINYFRRFSINCKIHNILLAVIVAAFIYIALPLFSQSDFSLLSILLRVISFFGFITFLILADSDTRTWVKKNDLMIFCLVPFLYSLLFW